MFSIWTRNSTSPTQIIANIEGVLDAVLDLCTVNVHLLTHEERSSFMDEYSSLTDARDGLDKGAKYSKLTEALDKCEALKLKIHRRVRELQIRRGRVVSAAISSATEARKSPIEPDPNTEDLILAQSNSTTTNGNRSPPGTSDLAVAQPAQQRQTALNFSTVLPTLIDDTECMIFEPGSSFGSPTFNIDSEGATGARLVPAQFNSTTRNGNSSRPASAGPGASPGSPQTTSMTSTLVPAPANNTGYVMLETNWATDSPTPNIASEGVAGATFLIGGPSPMHARQQLPASRVQPRTAHAVKRERENVMYFGPRSMEDSPTFNIRSPGASGVNGSTRVFDTSSATELFSLGNYS